MGRKRKMTSVEEGLQYKLLPPCRVCDGPAGGFHYGVNTCEACKGFFHRSTKGTQHYRCDTEGNCRVNFKNPKICKKCRYAKCLSVGMGKHAIKTGRYTVEKRTQDTKELQSIGAKLPSPIHSLDSIDNSVNITPNEKLEDSSSLQRVETCKESSVKKIAQQDYISAGLLSSVGPSPTSNSFCQSTSSERSTVSPECDSFGCLHETVSSYSGSFSNQLCHSFPISSTPLSQGSVSSPETVYSGSTMASPTLIPTSIPHISNTSCSMQSASPLSQVKDSSTIISSQPSCSDPCVNSTLQHLHKPQTSLQDSSSVSPSLPYGFTDMQINNTLQEEDNTSAYSRCSGSVDELSELYSDTDRVVGVLLQAKAKHLEPMLAYMSEEEFKIKAKEYLETCRLRREMFGNLQRLPDQEYDRIYESTGIDADGRKHRLENLSLMLENQIRAVAKFAKCIPGFGLLSIEDQVTLIKHSRGEVLLATGYNLVEPNLRVILCADGHLRAGGEGTGDLCRKEQLSDYISLCLQQRNIHLTTEEKVVLTAIVLMAPDRSGPMHCSKISVIYELLCNCLIGLFHDSSEEPLQKFAQVVSLMLALRTFGDSSAKRNKRLRMDKYTKVKSNPLLKDMLAGVFFDVHEGEEVGGAAHGGCNCSKLLPS